jgi:hypothetical protein
MSGDHNQYQKPTSKDSLQVKAMKLALDAAPVEEPPNSTNTVVESEKREWVGLTDGEITELFCNYDGSQFLMLIRAIEAKLKEKNYD